MNVGGRVDPAAHQGQPAATRGEVQISSEISAWTHASSQRMQLEIVELRRGEEARIELSGELDIATGSQVIDATRRALRGRPRRLQVDLGAVDFIDLTGVRTLIHCRRLTSGRDCEFVLARPSAAALQLLDLTGLRAVFEIRM